jgi:predicted HicB family RNase H-like nuclease
MDLQDKICKGCGDTFSGSSQTEYCPKCRKIRYEYSSDKVIGYSDKCIDCGTEFIRTSPAQKYCAECSKKHSTASATKAKAAYNNKAYDRIEMKVPKGQKENILNHAKSQGESLNQFLNRAVHNQIDMDNN